MYVRWFAWVPMESAAQRKKLGLRWKFKTSRPIVSCSEACSEATLSHQRAHDLGWPVALATDPFARLYKCSPRTTKYLTIWEANEYKLMLEKNTLQAVCSCRSSKQGTLLLGSLAKHSSIVGHARYARRNSENCKISSFAVRLIDATCLLCSSGVTAIDELRLTFAANATWWKVNSCKQRQKEDFQRALTVERS